MTLSKVIRAQEEVSYTAKWLPDHKNDLDRPKPHPATITPKIAHSALSRDPIAVTSVTNHYVYALNWPKTRPAKITPKIAHSVLAGDPTAVTSVTNHSIFIK